MPAEIATDISSEVFSGVPPQISLGILFGILTGISSEIVIVIPPEVIHGI